MAVFGMIGSPKTLFGTTELSQTVFGASQEKETSLCEFFVFMIKETQIALWKEDSDKLYRLHLLAKMCAQKLEEKFSKYMTIDHKCEIIQSEKEIASFDGFDCAVFLIKEIIKVLKNANMDTSRLPIYMKSAAIAAFEEYYNTIKAVLPSNNNRESTLAKIDTIHKNMHALIRLYKIPMSDRKASFRYRKMAFLRFITANPNPAKQIFTNTKHTNWLDEFDQQFEDLSNLVDESAISMIGAMTAEQKLEFQDFMANTKSTISRAYHVFDFVELLDAMTNDPTHLNSISFPKGFITTHPLAMFIIMNRARNLIAHGDMLHRLIEKNPRMKQLYTGVA